MAARTASVTGLWSNTATWGGSAVPVNGDSVTVNAGVVVTVDVDESGFASGLLSIALNGTLKFSASAGSYALKLAGNLTMGAASVLYANNGLGVDYPLNCTAQLIFNGAFGIIRQTGAVLDLRGIEGMTHKYVTLSQAESSGVTTLHVNADLTAAGDSGYWVANALVEIVNNVANRAFEQRTISSVTSTTIVLTGATSAAYPSGAYVYLVSRNVKIINISAAGTILSGTGSGAYLCIESRIFANGVSVGLNDTFKGVWFLNTLIFSGLVTCTMDGLLSASTAVQTCSACTITGSLVGCTVGGTVCLNCNFNVLSLGCTSSWQVCVGCVISGTMQGSTNGVRECSSCILSALIANNQVGTAVLRGGGLTFLDCIFSLNPSGDLVNIGAFVAYRTQFNSTVQFSGYNTTSRAIWLCSESFDDGGVANAYKNWCAGGITNSTTGTVYPGRVRSYQHVLENAPTYSVYSLRDQLIEVPAGGWVNVNCFIQKDASMSYLPRVQIFDASKEPLVSGSPDTQTLMTNSTNTWEILFAKFQNTSTAPKFFKVRVIASNASGNVYEDTDISTSPFGFAIGEAA